MAWAISAALCGTGVMLASGRRSDFNSEGFLKLLPIEHP